VIKDIVTNTQGIVEFQDFMLSMPGALVGDSKEYLEVCPLKHSFVDGAYVREIFLPKDMFFITKIHKKTHPYFVMSGCVSVLVGDEAVKIKGPFAGITKAGTKRLIYTHEDTTWITVHVTNETDISKIEDEVISKSFDEFNNTTEIKSFAEKIKEITP
jgi:hypothetical protein